MEGKWIKGLGEDCHLLITFCGPDSRPSPGVCYLICFSQLLSKVDVVTAICKEPNKAQTVSSLHKIMQQVNGELQVYLKLSKLSLRPQMKASSSPTFWFFLSWLFHEGHAYRTYFLCPNRDLKGLVKNICIPYIIKPGAQSELRKIATPGIKSFIGWPESPQEKEFWKK